ncbi:hypothetical protein AAG906_026907 [Vitis piasezkii]
MASSSHRLFHCCFQDWINQQHQDLQELLQVLDTDSPDSDHLRHLIQKSLQHFQDYSATRAELSKLDAPSFFCPSWITSFENSFLWLGGCRPSLAIRLLYSISGAELQAQLPDFLKGCTRRNLADISATQLISINALHGRVVREEDRLSSRMATMQEDTADEPLAIIAKKLRTVGEYSRTVNSAIETHSQALARVLEEADKLRLSTFKGLQEILTPLQGAHFLVASKKLHLSMHEWARSAKEEKRNSSIFRYHIEIGEGKRKYSSRKVCGSYACLVRPPPRPPPATQAGTQGHPAGPRPRPSPPRPRPQGPDPLLPVLPSHVLHRPPRRRFAVRGSLVLLPGALPPLGRRVAPHHRLPPHLHPLQHPLRDPHRRHPPRGSQRELQCQTVGEENEITAELSECFNSVSGLVGAVFDPVENVERLRNVVERAENLRFRTICRVVEILNPQQAVEFLVAVMELQFWVRGMGLCHDRVRENLRGFRGL